MWYGSESIVIAGVNLQYIEYECISYGGYQSTTYDRFVDGICCFACKSSYSLYVNDVLIGSGGNFTYFESHLFGECDSAPTISSVQQC